MLGFFCVVMNLDNFISYIRNKISLAFFLMRDRVGIQNLFSHRNLPHSDVRYADRLGVRLFAKDS